MAELIGRASLRSPAAWPITVVVSLAGAVVLVVLLADRQAEFVAALSAAAAWVLAVIVLLQIVALVARSEAWHLTLRADGGTVRRHVLYRASSTQVLGSVVNGNLGVSAVSLQVPTLIVASVRSSLSRRRWPGWRRSTLVGPLGLPWWLLLHAVGVDASLLDAVAVLIAVVTLGQLPVGPSVGAVAAAVLILGSQGVAPAAVAGVLMTVTGTVGGLCFAAWAGGGRLWSARRRATLRRARTRRCHRRASG